MLKFDSKNNPFWRDSNIFAQPTLFFPSFKKCQHQIKLDKNAHNIPEKEERKEIVELNKLNNWTILSKNKYVSQISKFRKIVYKLKTFLLIRISLLNVVHPCLICHGTKYLKMKKRRGRSKICILCKSPSCHVTKNHGLKASMQNRTISGAT